MIDKIYNEDCLVGMKRIPDGSVDFILTDLPYNVLNPQTEWDTTPPLENLREEFLRIIKSNGAIALFSSGRFTFELGTVFKDYFKYKFVWKKQTVSGFINCKYRPLTAHEDILIFSKGTAAPRASNNMTYNPQGLIRIDKRINGADGRTGTVIGAYSCNEKYKAYVRKYGNYPRDVLEFNALASSVNRLHTSQKPTDLLEYLIKTYTNEGELVLDATIGSGSTAVACINTGRHFIGFETDKHFFEVANDRIAKTYEKQGLFKSIMPFEGNKADNQNVCQ